MPDIGSLSKAINAQNVRLKRAGTDEFITLHNITRRKSTPLTRIITRSGAIDFSNTPLVEISATAVCTKAVFDQLEADSTRNARGALPTVSFTLVGESLSGAADDITVTFNANVYDVENIAGETGEFLVRFTLRVV